MSAWYSLSVIFAPLIWLVKWPMLWQYRQRDRKSNPALFSSPLTQGGTKIVLNPKGMSTEFIDAWAAFREDYWIKEEERVCHRGVEHHKSGGTRVHERRHAVGVSTGNSGSTATVKKRDNGSKRRDGSAHRGSDRRAKPMSSAGKRSRPATPTPSTVSVDDL
jgi:hypothetical protein